MAKVNKCEWCGDDLGSYVDNRDSCSAICGICYDLMVNCSWTALENRYATKLGKPAGKEKDPLDILAAPILPKEDEYWKDASKMLGFDFNEKKK